MTSVCAATNSIPLPSIFPVAGWGGFSLFYMDSKIKSFWFGLRIHMAVRTAGVCWIGGERADSLGKSDLIGLRRSSARQLLACELQPMQISEYGDGNVLAAEEFAGSLLNVFCRHCFNALYQFVESVEAVEVHHVASEI